MQMLTMQLMSTINSSACLHSLLLGSRTCDDVRFYLLAPTTSECEHFCVNFSIKFTPTNRACQLRICFANGMLRLTLGSLARLALLYHQYFNTLGTGKSRKLL